MKQYSTFIRDKKLEDDLKELDEKNKPVVEDPLDTVPDEKLTQEERTWKKRHSDLRSYSQKQLNEAKAREDAVKEELERTRLQLQEASKKQIKFPKTEDEVEDWVKAYPDVAGIVKSIAMKEVQKSNEEIDARFKILAEKEKKAAIQAAYNRLLGYHPDFEEIRETQEFQDWILVQPKKVVDALYDNELDAEWAASTVDLYKAFMEKKQKKPVDNTRSAASSVKVISNEPPEQSGKLKFTESMVDRMSPREAEANWPEIEKAMKNPAFFDLSGGAR